MTPPAIAAADLERVAQAGGPTDMVLIDADGALTLDATDDDIATYQIPGQWPRYLCRVSAITSALGRAPAIAAAEYLTIQFARALIAEPAPVSTTERAPIRLDGSTVTITGV